MKNRWLVALFLGILLNACNTGYTKTVQDVPELAATLSPASETARPSPITPTLIPSETPTDTPTPSKAAIPSPTETWIVPAVQTVDVQTMKNLERLPSGSEGCLPPCWNNLTPGESPPSEIPIFFSQFGRSFNDAVPSAVKNNPFLQKVSFTFTRLGFSYYSVRVVWGEDVELIDIWYSKNLDLFKEESFLHPSAIVQNVGIPDTAKLILYPDYNFGFLRFEIPNSNTVITYEVVVETLNGEPKLCLPPTEFEVDIQVLLYADSFDPSVYNNTSEYEDQSFYTGLTLEGFLSELTIVGRCIPVQYPDEST